MPYRRLPNTDNARLKALKEAYKKGKDLPPFKLAYTQSTFQKVKFFVDKFESAMTTYKNTYAIQVQKNKEFVQIYKKAKLYVSHFIQVMNMAVIRGELNQDTRNYYKLPKDEKKVPQLNTETELIKWGKLLIEGENERILKQLSPITNPTIAVVKVRYENFIDAYKAQKVYQQNSARALSKLATLRPEADQIILDVWNEVEKTYEPLPDDQKREKAEKYGLVYVYRKNELKSINILKNENLRAFRESSI